MQPSAKPFPQTLRVSSAGSVQMLHRSPRIRAMPASLPPFHTTRLPEHPENHTDMSHTIGLSANHTEWHMPVRASENPAGQTDSFHNPKCTDCAPSSAWARTTRHMPPRRIPDGQAGQQPHRSASSSALCSFRCHLSPAHDKVWCLGRCSVSRSFPNTSAKSDMMVCSCSMSPCHPHLQRRHGQWTLPKQHHMPNDSPAHRQTHADPAPAARPSCPFFCQVRGRTQQPTLRASMQHWGGTYRRCIR